MLGLKKATIGVVLAGLCGFVIKCSATLTAADWQLAQQLGWLSDNTAWCGGYYVQADFSQWPKLKPQQLRLTADQAWLNNGYAEISGKVVLQQGRLRLTTERAKVYRQQQRISRVELPGKTQILAPGILLQGAHALLDRLREHLIIDRVLYRLAAQTKRRRRQQHHLAGPIPWGRAQRISHLSTGDWWLSSTSYSTCPPLKPTWQLVSKQLHIQQQRGRADAWHTWLKWHNWPILYLPYVNFPIDHRRKTGLLLPTFAHARKWGSVLNLPLYLNLASNSDATLLPQYYSNRGLAYGGILRYLDRHTQLRISANLLWDDARFQRFLQSIALTNPQQSVSHWQNHRGEFHWHSYTVWQAAWQLWVDYNRVSDDYYFQDLRNNLHDTTRLQLPQRIRLEFHNRQWDGLANLANYQTLNPLNQEPVLGLYRQLPQLAVTYHPQFNWQNIHPQIRAEFVHFVWPKQNRLDNPSGYRWHQQLYTDYLWQNAFAFIQPALRLDFTGYLVDQPSAGISHQANRLLPVFDITSGVTFERRLSNTWQQTLTPKLYYLYVPYERQQQLPIFDSGLLLFDYAQLFHYNRFSGWDRLGDANRLTLALANQWLYQGQAVVAIKLAQAIHLARRRVDFCVAQQCQLAASNVNYTDPNNTLSPTVSLLQIQANRELSLIGQLAWDFPHNTLNNSQLALRYQRDPQHQAFLAYYAQQTLLATTAGGSLPSRDSANLIHIGSAWGINRHFGFIGSWGYNIAHDHLQGALFGLEYNSCCWAVRGLFARTLRAERKIRPGQWRAQLDNGFFIQIRLKGLGSFGNNDPSRLLQQAIPGYHDIFN